ncbi:MAG: rod shape-determining protein [Patescibacteria group bacterium]
MTELFRDYLRLVRVNLRLSMAFFKFFSRKLGIDLGTANTLVFVPGKGVVLNEPSVVAISEQGRRILAVGLDAKEMIGRTPESIVAYRPMKDGVIADYKVTEAMLRYYMNKALGKWNIWKPEVMVSVPAGVTSTERRAVVEAAVRAGAKSAYVVKEPILAAIGAGIPIQEARGHMVVDIGGGTTDVAVISLGGIVASTSVKCAGNKIDVAIADYIKKNFNLAIGDKTAEEVKINIGSAVPVEEELKMNVKGRDFITGLPRSVEIGTNEIVKAIGKELREIVKAIKDVLQETPPELSSDIIDQGITMTGGSSQLRNLPELVFRRTGVKAELAKDPYFCVVKGTGIALDHLDTYKKSILAKR